jgi:hypothetical protein
MDPVVTDVTFTLHYRVHGSLFNMFVFTDVTLTLYYRVHGLLFNMIVVTDVPMDTIVQS